MISLADVDQTPRRFRRGVAGLLRRVLLSSLASVCIITVASMGLFVTSWPKALSLLLEPFSLLLTPGVVGSLLFTQTHDYTESAILLSNFIFYFEVCFALFWAWDRRSRGRRSRRSV